MENVGWGFALSCFLMLGYYEFRYWWGNRHSDPVVTESHAKHGIDNIQKRPRFFNQDEEV